VKWRGLRTAVVPAATVLYRWHVRADEVIRDGV